MVQELDRSADAKRKNSEEFGPVVAQIKARDFRRARRDPMLRDFAKAADERLGKLRASGQID